MQRLLILFLSFSILVLGTFAQAEILTWDSCVKEVATGNGELSAARFSEEAAKDRSKATYGSFLPQVFLNGGVSRDRSGSAATPSSLTSETTSYSGSLEIRQNLFSGFLDSGSVREARAEHSSASADLRLRKAKVSYDLKSAFVGLKYSQDAVELADQILKRREENTKLVELRFEGGRENKGSVMLAKAAFAQSQYEALQAQQNLDIAAQELARVLGREQVQGLSVSGAVPLKEPPLAVPFEKLAVDNPEYQKASSNLAASEAQRLKTRSAFFPSVDAVANFGRLDERWFPQNERFSVGLNVSFPLFNGGRNFYETSAASKSLRAAFVSQTETARSLLVSLKQAHSRFSLSVQKLKVDSDFKNAAQVRAEIARKRYNNGLLSFEDWDAIENDLIQREKTLLQSERDRVIAEANWEQVQGKGAID